MKLKKSLGISILIALPVTSFPLFGFAPSSTITNPGQPVTAQQREQVLNGINGMTTPYGDFIRVHKLGNFTQSEIAYSVSEVNQNTQELIVSYGTFDKTTPAREKTDELADPQWAKHHILYTTDKNIIQNAIANHDAALKELRKK